MVKMINQIMTNNPCYTKPIRINPVGIMVHSTGAYNPKITRYVPIKGTAYSSNHWDKPSAEVSVHGFIGLLDEEICYCQTLPYNYKAWHCGRSGNSTHIAFEICEDELVNKDYFVKAMRAAQEVCAYLMKNVLKTKDVRCIVSHAEGYKMGIASNHGDIDHWLGYYGKTMTWFRDMVQDILDGKGDDEVMTQEQFNAMAEKFLQDRYNKPQSKWASDLKVMERAKQAGISDGTGPQGLATREQVATMLLNMLDGLKGE